MNYGCRIVISTADVSTTAGCNALIHDAQECGQIDGIFNVAVSLRDGLFENQTSQWFKESAAPKSYATTHLDRIVRQRGMELNYFVVFSSFSCGRGNAGQSNYGLANSVMERIIESRVSDGLSGKAIQWGTIGEVGLSAQKSKHFFDVVIAGTMMQRIASCISELDILLTTPDPIVGSMVVAKKLGSVIAQKNVSPIETVLTIMGIQNTNSISMNKSLADLGVDSLMAVEIKQALERDFEIVMSSSDLHSMTFQTLHKLSESATDEDRLVVRNTNADSVKYTNNFHNFNQVCHRNEKQW